MIKQNWSITKSILLTNIATNSTNDAIKVGDLASKDYERGEV